MSHILSNADRIRLLELYFKSGSFTETHRKFSTVKNIKRKSDAPSVPQMRSIIMKFRLTGYINKEHEVRSPRASHEKRKNMDTALQKMKAEATIPSIRKLSLLQVHQLELFTCF